MKNEEMPESNVPQRQLFSLLQRSYVLTFNAATTIVNCRLIEQLKKEGFKCSPREIWIMMCVEQKPCNQGNVARTLGINENVMVRQVDSMEKRGLIKRISLKDNRREKLLRLTDKGKELLQKVFENWHERGRIIWSPLTDEEITEMKKLGLRIVEDYFSKNKEGPRPSHGKV